MTEGTGQSLPDVPEMPRFPGATSASLGVVQSVRTDALSLLTWGRGGRKPQAASLSRVCCENGTPCLKGRPIQVADGEEKGLAFTNI